MKINKKFEICIILETTIVPKPIFDLIEWLKKHSDLSVSYILIPRSPKNYFIEASFLKNFKSILDQIGWSIIKLIENLYYRRFNSDSSKHFINVTNDELILDLRESVFLEMKISSFNQSILKKKKIDLILALNLNQYCYLLKQFSKLGLVSLDHFDPEKKSYLPLGFKEVFLRKGNTGFSILRLKKDIDIIDILFRGAFPTHNYFLANHFNILKRRNFYIKKYILLILHDALIKNPIKLNRLSSSIDLENAPTLIEQIIYVSSLFVQRFNNIKNKILNREKFWKVGFMYSDWENLGKTEMNEIKNFNNCYLADPFIIRVNEKNYCLAEEYNFDTLKGSIVAYELKDKSSRRIGKIIDESFHMSFPYLFVFQEKIFMIPETSENNDIRIYESLEFPHQWKLNQVLMRDVFAVDSMIFQHKEKWWLFTNINPEGGSEACSELYIFSSDNPLSKKWKPHLLNPVIVNSNSARNGGILHKNNKIFRVSQKQNFGRYGAEFSINEILKLTEDEFIEKKIKQVKPNFIFNGLATHHCHSNSDITVFDFLT